MRSIRRMERKFVSLFFSLRGVISPDRPGGIPASKKVNMQYFLRRHRAHQVVADTAWACPIPHCMWRSGVLLLLSSCWMGFFPSLLTLPLPSLLPALIRFSWKFTDTHLHPWVENSTVRVCGSRNHHSNGHWHPGSSALTKKWPHLPNFVWLARAEATRYSSVLQDWEFRLPYQMVNEKIT